jgi:hypothetical protein
LDRIEELFKRIDLPYSIYNRGLYADLKERGELDQIGEIYNGPTIEPTEIEEPIESVIEESTVMIERPMIESVIEYVMESIINEPVVVERPMVEQVIQPIVEEPVVEAKPQKEKRTII